LRADMLRLLLGEMEAIQWPKTTRERPKVAATGYIILQRPIPGANTKRSKREALKLNRYRGIWDKALEAIEQVDAEFASRFTALAVTMNFQGSPHIDTLNVGPFYGIAMGDYSEGGGKLCVECSPMVVAEIDTRGRFAKVDGRFPHWVSPYDENTGTRYSLIYYATSGQVVAQTTAIFEHAESQSGATPWVRPPVFEP
jgi:hypothetical protein